MLYLLYQNKTTKNMTFYETIELDEDTRDRLNSLSDVLKSEIVMEFAEMRFDMALYSNTGYPERINETRSNTVGCALGLSTKVYIQKRNNEDYSEYGLRLFCNDNEDVFEWLFAGQWANIDNTRFGVVKRINVLLNEGLPENFNKQKWGQEPLCY